jgi:hypothetical protein
MSKRTKKRKKKFHSSQISIYDELLFETDKEQFSAQNIHLVNYENIYTSNIDQGDDRLFLEKKGSSNLGLYIHISPHILAWHNNIPAEVVYNNELSKSEITPSVISWWMNTNSEVVTIYKYKKTDTIVSLLDYRNKIEIDKHKSLTLTLSFLSQCIIYFKLHGIFPTVMSPKRILVKLCGRSGSRHLQFFENGHFQLLPWQVNESQRIVDCVYTHPDTHTFSPTNLFKYIESYKLESKITGLLDFYIGSVLLIHFCLTGLISPSKNHLFKDEQLICKLSKGICKSMLVYDKKYYDFFHRFYCIIGLKGLSTSLKNSFTYDNSANEFLLIYEDFLSCAKNL